MERRGEWARARDSSAMETLRCLTVPGPVSSGQYLVENTCQPRAARQHCHPAPATDIDVTPRLMCSGDSGLYRETEPESDCVTDELDNQVITNGDQASLSDPETPAPSLDPAEQTEKRKQIGDEFYRGAEAESEGEARIVKLTTSIITVSSDSFEAIPTSVLATNNKTPTIVSTQAFLASSLESELNQKLQAQLLSDQDSSSPSPRHSPELQQNNHGALHTDLSGHPVHHGPQGKSRREIDLDLDCQPIIMRYMNFLLGQPLDLFPSILFVRASGGDQT